MKNSKTYQCEYCEEKGLNEKRNCNWNNPGTCVKCGGIPFRDVISDPQTSKFTCPMCGGRVRFGKGEFLLGRTFRTPGCPKNKITERAVFLIQLVNWSEEVKVLPTATCLMNESLLYFEIRNFVKSEESIMEQEMAPKDKP